MLIVVDEPLPFSLFSRHQHLGVCLQQILDLLDSANEQTVVKVSRVQNGLSYHKLPPWL